MAGKVKILYIFLVAKSVITEIVIIIVTRITLENINTSIFVLFTRPFEIK